MLLFHLVWISLLFYGTKEMEKGIVKRLILLLLTTGLVLFSAQGPRFATQVLPETTFVENADFALGEPDGKFAGIELYGSLDLEVMVNNEDGDDLAVYAERPRTGIVPETLNYAVFVKKGRDEEWTFVGFGGGWQSPETFDLGEVKSADKVKIMFRDTRDHLITVRPYRTYPEEYRMGIDAVIALH